VKGLGVAVKGPRFWAITGAISGFCTLSSALTIVALLFRIHHALPLDEGTILLINFAIFLISLGSGLIGLVSMALSGFSDVGRIEIRGRLLPKGVMPALCIPLYLAPWGIVAALRWQMR
jgi:hypothetical protein